MSPKRRLGVCLVAALALGACRGEGDSVLLLVVTAAGSPPPVASLTVTLTIPSGSSSNVYSNGAPITFPTTLSAELPASATGSVRVGVVAVDSSGATVAYGQAPPFSVGPGSRLTQYVSLSCGGTSCAVDGGVESGSDGGASAPGGCGNGRIDPGETCDTAILPGAPGACPPADCNDGIACTVDSNNGTSGCRLVCTHTPVTSPIAGDGCCPAGATHANDPDCSPTCNNGTVEAGESCDTKIAPGLPGACPTPGACSVPDPCTITLLVSAGTCQALCLHYQVSDPRPGDGCCPPGGTSATDSDCPALCGDGVRQTNESCDTGIVSPNPGSCPQSCDDGNACTTDFLVGSGCNTTCAHVAITAPISGDGCCPMGATRATDSDCPALCGNGVVDPGETCDPKATGPGACPQSCPPSPAACLQTALTGTPSDCSAACTTVAVTGCSAVSDGCCPSGCTAATDPDCSPTCGDGVVQAGETCDTAIGAGAGACPKGCDDGDPCTTDLLLSAGTCSAACAHLPVTAFVAGDGCCPPGGDLDLDPDCPAVCGDGFVDRPVETCDDAVPGSCPSSCPPLGSCTVSTLRGSPTTCSAACVVTPITACVGGDGCCPAGCTQATDPDCPAVCGDRVVEAGEACDRAITAGFAGACASTCDDGNACTIDIASGSPSDCSRNCTHIPIVACLDNDGCCPSGCSASNDTDCTPTCGDGKVEAGETCDPPSSCPTTCPDDGDPCTTEVLVGSPATCDVACRHVPITSCSGSTADHCCPTGCTSATDRDC
jgi:hypothetical protein